MSQPRFHSFALRVSLFLATCIATAISLTAPSGCDVNEKDPFYCPDRPNNYCACRSDAECAAPAGVCDVATTNTCVECTPDNASACAGTKPLCGADNTCRACAAHADCSSSVCLADGACAAEATVAYVAPTGTDNDLCSKAMPCTKVGKALATARPYVKLSGTTNESLMISAARKVTFYADVGAKLRAGATNSPIVTVRDNGTAVTIYDLAISDAPNDASGFGVLVPTGGGAPSVSLIRATVSNNPAGGISVAGGTLNVSQSTISGNAGGGISVAGGTLNVSQSTISGNQGGGISVAGGTLNVSQSTISGNAGGGISVSNGTFDITNNFIVGNGSSDMVTGSDFGGLSLSAGAGANRLEQNTVAYNHAKAGTLLAAGVGCSVTNLVAPGNIVTSNNEGLSFSAQTKGVCTYGNSFTAPGSEANGLKFKSITTNPPDFHLTSESPTSVLDAGGACTGSDVDGEPRPQGAACDLGADEFKP
jgi:hypothetical protein